MAESTKGPLSVGVIMDGNRRWARQQGLAAASGHAAGFAGYEAGEATLFRLLDEYRALREKWGTAHYIFYAFSTENWSRTAEEVADLMGIFERSFAKIEERVSQLLADGARVRFIGQRERFSPELQALMRGLEEKTAQGSEGTIAIAVSYGARADIVRAVNALAAQGNAAITERDLQDTLSTRGIPEPDLIIRTGGDRRLSNFLLFESAYAELAFTDTLWPDFSRAELERIFVDFASRERRHGR
jgi:undecaprenyl diphosphate synthase